MSFQVAEAAAPASGNQPADFPWWLASRQLNAAIERDAATSTSVYYRFGDAILELASDDPALLETFDALYGECVVSRPAGPDEPRVRCTVLRGIDRGPIVVTFLRGAPPEPAAGALSLFQPTGIVPPYSVYDSPIPGWRLAGSSTRPVVAVNGGHVLVDSQLTRPDFLVEYLVTATLAAQPELLVAHAAALRIDDAGVLLAGPSHSGKTTLSLHLAARGHGFYTDDAATIRLATTEVVPLRQAVRVRPAPRAPEVAAALEALGKSRPQAIGRDADGSMLVHVGDLFPGAFPAPTRLRAAFFLNGFAERPALSRFQFTLQKLGEFDTLGSMDMAFRCWGFDHARRAIRLLALRQVLAQLPCWLLTVGTPGDTARLVEHTLEEG
ncbi:MAG TPA: hypothetical protein VM164_05200 [Burkholderiales bacterium]|nr:hypothetical protein [Burkholderiales bacterium]